MKYLVIGGGIVGLATARQILRSKPGASLQLLEKEDHCGLHQSTHNSGVLHAGLYYKPGSLKAQLAVKGIRMMTAFCQEHGVAHEICGKVVVATEPEEIPRLETLHERGIANGLQGIRRLSKEELKEREPFVAGIEALIVPEEGIVDYAAVIRELRREIESLGGTVTTGAQANTIERLSDGWLVHAEAGEFRGDFIVNCAGLFCDRVARLAGYKPGLKIVPFRGEYFTLRQRDLPLVNHLIYPVPDPQFPFLGVHFTRMIGGGIEAGPNAVLAFSREGYKKTDFRLDDFAETLSYSGLWKFLKQYRGMCFQEFLRSLDRRRFLASLQRLVPAVTLADLSHGGAGVRAQAMDPQGGLIQDFAIVSDEAALHVLNAPSPGATASLAIAEHLMTYL